MKVAVFGLGYVGCVSLGCLAKAGHELVGVDISPVKVGLINDGRPTIVESGVEELVRTGWEDGRVSATTDPVAGLNGCAVSILCVGTPNLPTGHLDMRHVKRAAETIADGLRDADGFHVVCIRSTVMPGTNHIIGTLIESRSGKRRGEDFEIVSNPEFLREGSAVWDFFNPPVTVIGTHSDRAYGVVSELYQAIEAPVRRTTIGVAESIKLVNNSWHALKVSFANEVGVLCKEIGVDSHELMDLFCQDSKLNLSPYYLRPGFAYGGSCLPKDLKALTTMSHDQYLDTPVLDAVHRSNTLHKQRLVDLVAAKGLRKVGILGLSFKPGTDDLRSSPIVEVAETLIGRGFTVRIYDRNVHLSKLVGANREYIDAHIPHLAELISNDLDTVLAESEIVIVANKEPEFQELGTRSNGKHIVDLVRVPGLDSHGGGYDGIAW